MKIFIKGLGQSLVIAMGYLPVAIAFGVTSVKMGLYPVEAIMASILVFAGASQFMLVALWSKGTGLAMVSLIMFLINLRHVFYGPTLLSKTKPGKRYLLPLISFGITDEVYATSLARSDSIVEEERLSWTAGLEIGAYLAWVSGTAIGSVLGDQALKNYPVIESTLSFALSALFLSLFLSILDFRNIAMLASTAVPVVILQHFGFTSAAVIAGIISGVTSSALFGKKV